jgi:hypothetical protein
MRPLQGPTYARESHSWDDILQIPLFGEFSCSKDANRQFLMQLVSICESAGKIANIWFLGTRLKRVTPPVCLTSMIVQRRRCAYRSILGLKQSHSANQSHTTLGCSFPRNNLHIFDLDNAWHHIVYNGCKRGFHTKQYRYCNIVSQTSSCEY